MTLLEVPLARVAQHICTYFSALSTIWEKKGKRSR